MFLRSGAKATNLFVTISKNIKNAISYYFHRLSKRVWLISPEIEREVGLGAFAVGGNEKLSTGRGRHGRGEMTSKMRGGRSRISVTRRRRAFIRNHFSSQILSPSLPCPAHRRRWGWATSVMASVKSIFGRFGPGTSKKKRPQFHVYFPSLFCKVWEPKHRSLRKTRYVSPSP